MVIFLFINAKDYSFCPKYLHKVLHCVWEHQTVRMETNSLLYLPQKHKKENIIFQTSQQFASILNSQARSVAAAIISLSVCIQFSVAIRLCACIKNYVCGSKEKAEFQICLHIIKQFIDWAHPMGATFLVEALDHCFIKLGNLHIIKQFIATGNWNSKLPRNLTPPSSVST